jgi:hypothetical protein
MLGGKGKGGRVGQLESPSGTELSPCLRVANLQKIFFLSFLSHAYNINIQYEAINKQWHVTWHSAHLPHIISNITSQSDL